MLKGIQDGRYCTVFVAPLAGVHPTPVGAPRQLQIRDLLVDRLHRRGRLEPDGTCIFCNIVLLHLVLNRVIMVCGLEWSRQLLHSPQS
jgi:hypothetical protein